MSHASVVFSFDDYSETWAEQLPLLESLQIRATFFIAGEFMRDGKTAEARLRPLVDAGHSIGVHTFSHRRATEMWATEGTDWLDSDVLTQARMLAQFSGRQTPAFAYPYGDHDDATDRILAKHFHFVRTFGRMPLFATRAQLRRGGITYATSIDNAHGRDHAWYEARLTDLARQSQVWVVASHHFNDSRWGITPARLTRFVESARNLGVELSRFEDFI